MRIVHGGVEMAVNIGDLVDCIPDGGMSAEDAREIDMLIRASNTLTKLGVFMMWCKSGYTTLGFDSFPKYVRDHLQLPQRTVDGWLCVVQATLKKAGVSSDQLLKMIKAKQSNLRLVTKKEAEIILNPNRTKMINSKNPAFDRTNDQLHIRSLRAKVEELQDIIDSGAGGSELLRQDNNNLKAEIERLHGVIAEKDAEIARLKSMLDSK